MPAAYSISDLSSEFGVTPRTLRFYEERLTPTHESVKAVVIHQHRLGWYLYCEANPGYHWESAELIGMYDPASNNREQTKRLIEKIKHDESNWWSC